MPGLIAEGTPLDVEVPASQCVPTSEEPPMRKNDDTFKMRLASDELDMLHAIAEERRVSAAHVVRELVRREFGKMSAAKHRSDKGNK